jgi:hypothetical protein
MWGRTDGNGYPTMVAWVATIGGRKSVLSYSICALDLYNLLLVFISWKTYCWTYAKIWTEQINPMPKSMSWYVYYMFYIRID